LAHKRTRIRLLAVEHVEEEGKAMLYLVRHLRLARTRAHSTPRDRGAVAVEGGVDTRASPGDRTCLPSRRCHAGF
jgi:hypothetical protein